jgi:hypothetical protein
MDLVEMLGDIEIAQNMMNDDSKSTEDEVNIDELYCWLKFWEINSYWLGSTSIGC